MGIGAMPTFILFRDGVPTTPRLEGTERDILISMLKNAETAQLDRSSMDNSPQIPHIANSVPSLPQPKTRNEKGNKCCTIL
jgi:hypothetical protein